MAKQNVRKALTVCRHFRLGYIDAVEMCKKVIFFCITPETAAEVLTALPEDVRGALLAFVQTLPTSSQGWSRYQGIAQLDGNELTLAAQRAECRAATEAVRGYFASG